MEAFKYGCIVDGEYFCARPELIYDFGGERKFVSPFFREWIRRRN